MHRTASLSLTSAWHPQTFQAGLAVGSLGAVRKLHSTVLASRAFHRALCFVYAPGLPAREGAGELPPSMSAVGARRGQGVLSPAGRAGLRVGFIVLGVGGWAGWQGLALSLGFLLRSVPPKDFLLKMVSVCIPRWTR